MKFILFTKGKCKPTREFVIFHGSHGIHSGELTTKLRHFLNILGGISLNYINPCNILCGVYPKYKYS